MAAHSEEDLAWEAWDPPHFRPGDEAAFRAGWDAGTRNNEKAARFWRERASNEALTAQQLESDILALGSQIEELEINETLVVEEYESKIAKRDRFFARLYEGEDLEEVLEEFRRMRADEILGEIPEGGGEDDNG